METNDLDGAVKTVSYYSFGMIALGMLGNCLEAGIEIQGLDSGITVARNLCFIKLPSIGRWVRLEARVSSHTMLRGTSSSRG